MTSPLTPHLILYTETGKRYLALVGTNCWTIGRSDDNNFVLPDRWISRNHAMLQCMDNGEFYLIDLGSRNGTFVNGRRVSVPVTLRNADRLTFGQTELEFFCPSSPTPDFIGGADAESQDFTATATLHVRRLISILVIDIRDFTVMTRQLDEKILSEVIGTWFRRAGDIIREYGSWVDKYIGDAVMAVWIHGPEGLNHDEVVRIIRAISALHKMTSQLHRQYPLPFPLRIGAGLNTGYAMVGNAGTGDRPDYTALGDTVNAAFRFETSTKQLKMDVAIGETFYEKLAELNADDQLFSPYVVNMKGYDTPIATHAGTFGNLDEFLSQVDAPPPPEA